MHLLFGCTIIRLLLGIALFWIAVPDLSLAETQAGKSPVKLQLQYFHQFQFAGFYAAQYLGLYDKSDLDVTIQEGGPQHDPIESVLRGSADFGVSDTDVLWRRLKGDPLVALGVIFQHSAYCLVSLARRNIMTLDDLRGKRVGIAEGRGSYLFKAMFRKQGIELDEVTLVPPRWNLESIVRGEIDANGAYATGELYRLRELNIPYHVIYPVDYGVEFYGDTLFTDAEYLAKHPDLVEKFRQATFDGWAYAFEHPEEVIDYILAQPSVQKRRITRDRLRYEATVMRHLILPDIIELGSMNQARWEKMARELVILDPQNLRIERLKGFVYQLPAVQSHLMAQRFGFVGAGIVLLLIFSLGWVFQLQRAVKERTRDTEEAMRLADLRSEEAKSANAAKTMFLASISHEFRTPLTAILGFSELMKTTILSQQQRAWMKIIQTRAQDLLALVNQTLELIQSESSTVSSKISTFNLEEELAEIEASFDPLFRSKNIKFTLYSIPLDLPPLQGPLLVLRQILINLISNASKFVSDEGHIELYCREQTKPGIPAGKYCLCFSVIDDGPGVPAEIGPVVFDSFMHPFRQKLEKKQQGFGLGLSICKRLVATLGGEIWYENRPEGGCAFHFTALFSEGKSEAPATLPNLQSSQRKILLVEDDPVNRELIRTYLAMSGLSAVEADTGQKAITNCEQESYDLILMDIGLPDIDGVKTSEQIKNSPRSKNRQTPIVALTASALAQERERCLQVGMCHYLSKPINFKDLMHTINSSSKAAQTQA